MCPNRSPTMKVPLLVGVLFLPIDTGMVLMTSPLRRTVSVLVLSSTVAMTSSPTVKCDVTFSWPNSPSPRSTP